MKTILTLSLIALLSFGALFTLPASAQNNTSSDTIDSYIENEFEKTHFPGMSVQIVNVDTTLFTQTYGNCTSLDDGFIIGSLSKSFTATCIMKLVEEGKLNLSDTIAQYLPQVNPSCKTTVLQLLNQTSGIHTYDTTENFVSTDFPSEFEYANVNYALLGKIIETVSGTSYSSYVQANVFKPLGMNHSATSLEQARANGLTPGYRNYLGLMREESYPYPDASHTGWLTIPAGYITSSTNDMGRYLQMYLRNDSTVLQKSSIDTMIHHSVDCKNGYRYGFGLGTHEEANGDITILHGGNVENYTSYMILMPKHNIALIALFNACDYAVANGMAVTLTSNILQHYRGTETNDLDGTTYLKNHALLNGGFFILLLFALLPLLLIKRWHTKNMGKIRKRTLTLICVFHVIAPTFLLLIPSLLGIPLGTVRGFMPDFFIILITSSILLYATGVLKVRYLLLNRKDP